MYVGIIPTAGGIPIASGITSGLAVLVAALALRGALRLRATTLAAPCLWAVLSSVCLAAGALLESRFDGIGLSALQFSIAATTFCPLMAVLGAKRPQNRGWQWVVLTLWVVLILPAIQAVLLPAGARVELFIAWKLFLWGLIVVGLFNYLPTRRWLAALGLAAGQIFLLRAHLGLSSSLPTEWSLTIGVGCLLLAALLMYRPNPQRADQRRLSDASQTTLGLFDTRWRSFRDAYGAFWALRMLGRINHAAALREWPFQLSWSRFVLEDRQPTAAHLAELEQTMVTLLRRFVDQNVC